MTEIFRWLEKHGLSRYARTFEEQGIELDLLHKLTEQEYVALGVNIGDRKRLSALVAESGFTQGSTPYTAVERRQLTVLFCDLVDSTRLSVKYDPEQYRDIIAAYRTVCRSVIEKRGGFLVQFQGDGVVAYFGYPTTRENETANCVHAAIEVVAAVRNLDVFPDLLLQTRVGIALGEVVIGDDAVRDRQSLELAAIGSAPNLAARLQDFASQNCVVVSDEVQQITDSIFEYEFIGEKSFKGFTELVKVWQTSQQKDHDSIDASLAEHPLSLPMIGREAELAMLIKHWTKANNSEGQVVHLFGEAGIGKSRLIEEFSVNVNAGTDPARLMKLTGNAHYNNTALFPFIQFIERSSGIEQHDQNITKIAKTEKLLSTLTSSSVEERALICELMGIEYQNRFPPVDTSPQRRKELTQNLLVQLLLSGSNSRSLLVVAEDLHWFDPTSMEVLGELASKISDSRTMVLSTSRENTTPHWEQTLGIAQIELTALPDSTIRQIAQNIAGDENVDSTLITAIAEKADGIPLFIEELTRVLMTQRQGSEPDLITLPITLRDSLTARLDALENGKLLAQQASAIGREFTHRVIEKISNTSSTELNTKLHNLIEEGLIFELEGASEKTFSFKHALIRDAAYSTLLLQDRQSLHAQIAHIRESVLPELTALMPEITAYHLEEAGLLLQSIQHRQQAAQRDANRAAHMEAEKHLQIALASTAALSGTKARDLLELNLQVQRGLCIASSKGYAYPLVRETYDRASDLCRNLELGPEQLPILRGLCEFYIVRAELNVADEVSELYLDLALKLGDPRRIIEAYTPRSYVYAYRGELASAEALLETCLTLYNAHKGESFQTPQDPGVACLAILAIVQCLQGKFEEGHSTAQRSVQLARELKQPFSEAYALAHESQVHQLCGKFEDALMRANDTMNIAKAGGFDVWVGAGALNFGVAKSLAKDHLTAIATLEPTLAAWRLGGAEINRPYWLAHLAYAELAAGNLNPAKAYIDEAIEHQQLHAENYHEPLLHLYHGEIGLARDDTVDEVRASFERALSSAKQQGSVLFELRALTALSRLGDTNHLDILRKVINDFESSSTIPFVEDALAILDA